MISLNTEKGFVRIDCWEDIESRPGFTALLDPKAIKLKEIIGRYAFPYEIPCGLSNCRTPHQYGFLVVATDGRETNIGRDCGKREFGADFNSMSRVFLAAERAQRNREFLGELKNRLPIVAAEISEMKNCEHGAVWINARVNQLSGKSGSLPLPIVNAVRQAIRRGDGTLMLERVATKQEREDRSAAVAVAGLENRQRRVVFAVEERVGQLDGFSALSPGSSLRDLLVVIEPVLTELADADIDSLSDTRLRCLTKRGGELEPNLERLREVVAAGKRLLVRKNVQQLSQFAKSSSESNLFSQFLREIPP